MQSLLEVFESFPVFAAAHPLIFQDRPQLGYRWRFRPPTSIDFVTLENAQVVHTPAIPFVSPKFPPLSISRKSPSRSDLHPVASPSCATLLKALADPSRLAIMRALLESALSVSDLCRTLQLPQSLASRHLSILRGMGLVAAHRQGQRIIYDIPPATRASIRGAGRGIDLGCCELRFR
ncbi:MAG: metalloregulator ArsR/SmtB family transcription factor [Deltaproteobacteria bacterium]|nr:metalloregulator ArsR/SmtB family transcription factor [Deltaproteobacteria bacterium]